jgi:hypothetical protein
VEGYGGNGPELWNLYAGNLVDDGGIVVFTPHQKLGFNAD